MTRIILFSLAVHLACARVSQDAVKPIMNTPIAGDEHDYVVIGNLDYELNVSCPVKILIKYNRPDQQSPAPLPSGIVKWKHGHKLIVNGDTLYKMQEDTLAIKRLSMKTLGEYTCEVNQGQSNAVSWVTSVRAYRLEGNFTENRYLVPRSLANPVNKPHTTKEGTTATTTDKPLNVMAITIGSVAGVIILLETVYIVHLKRKGLSSPGPIQHSETIETIINNDKESRLSMHLPPQISSPMRIEATHQDYNSSDEECQYEVL